MLLFDWCYITSCQIGIKQLSGYVILNLGYHLNNLHMKWFWRGVNPNSIVFYGKMNFPLLIFQRWTRKSFTSLRNHICHPSSFFSNFCFQFASCTLAKWWSILWILSIHQPVNVYRNCLKQYLICGTILRSIALLQKLQNEIKKKFYCFKV